MNGDMHAYVPRAFFLCAIAGALAACTDAVTQLEHYDPQSIDFASALAGEYLQYAEAEKELKHYADAQYFGDKGLKATQGVEVAPETVPSSLPAAEKSALVNARARLAQALNDKARDTEILKAARAQMMFDCWARNVERGQKEGAATCRGAFFPALEELERAVGIHPTHKKQHS